jgi:hypothetical protein
MQSCSRNALPWGGPGGRNMHYAVDSGLYSGPSAPRMTAGHWTQPGSDRDPWAMSGPQTSTLILVHPEALLWPSDTTGARRHVRTEKVA